MGVGVTAKSSFAVQVSFDRPYMPRIEWIEWTECMEWMDSPCTGIYARGTMFRLSKSTNHKEDGDCLTLHVKNIRIRNAVKIIFLE